MKKKSLFYSLCLTGMSFFTVATAQAIPPKDEFKTIVQPSGEKLGVLVFGDSSFKWLETRLGYVILLNSETGSYEFALINNQESKLSLSLSGINVTSNTPDDTLTYSKQFARHSDAVKIRIQTIKLKTKDEY